MRSRREDRAEIERLERVCARHYRNLTAERAKTAKLCAEIEKWIQAGDEGGKVILELRAKTAKLVEALRNELADDSPERHTYETCTAGEGDEVNAERGCMRCRAFLTAAAKASE